MSPTAARKPERLVHKANWRLPVLSLLILAAASFTPQASAMHETSSHHATCPSGNSAILSPTLTVVQGGTATAKFSIAAYCTNIRVSLASYDAPAFSFALPQTLIDSKSNLYNAGGPYTLTTNVSPCFFQVDLVRGDVIANLSTTNLYGSRVLKSQNAGTKCASRLTTTASAAVDIGGSISDSATLTGLSAAGGGTITFTAYGPDNATCSGTPAFTSAAVNVSGNGIYGSGSFTPTLPGTYRWKASYSGDSRNFAVAGACNDSYESVVVRERTPAMVTQASANVTVGGSTSDTATLSGATPTAGGTIIFKLFGPNDAFCTGPPIYTSAAVAVAGNSSYGSGSFTPTTAGTYRWIATYSGDTKNYGVALTCNGTNESVTISPRGPTINTHASADVAFGNPVNDAATLAGATATATGTITFNLYGPDNASCSGAPVFTSAAIAVSGNGTYGSGDFTPTLSGTYRWTASYSGDTNNLAVATACNEANESVMVGREDQSPPLCALTQIVPGPPKQVKVTVEDPESGIASITVDAITNATAPIPGFASGTTSPIVITATKTDQTKSSFVRLKVVNKVGLTTYCDPVVPAVKKRVRRSTSGAAGERQAKGSGATLKATTRQVLFGAEQGVTLFGRIPGARAGQTVNLISQSCGFNAPSQLSKLTTGRGGVFRYRFLPGLNTTFSIRWSGGASKAVRVLVQPSVVLTRESAGRYRVDASTTNGHFLEKPVGLQRWSGSRWVNLGQSVLSPNSPEDAMTAVSSATFAANAYGAKLRAVLPASACYARSASAGIRG